jgi:hypothetical protein
MQHKERTLLARSKLMNPGRQTLIASLSINGCAFFPYILR